MSFDKLLRPKTVAIIGASSDERKVGNNVLDNVINGGFEGEIYPINPKVDQILGKQCYKSLLDIPGEVDLAVIVIKRDLVLPMLKDCVKKGVKGVVVITAGFGETGEEGRQLQREMTSLVRENGITMMGPNCLGLINPWHKLNASFGQAINLPGPIGLISQSGALITAIQDIAANDKIGFSVLASLGNKAALDEVEFLKNLQKDENTKVIAAYLEDISRGQKFMKVAERVSKTKPVVVLKSGRTAAGAKAAASHTGSLAGADSAYTSAFERSGVVRADSIEHLFDIATAFAYQPLPKGDRVAVVTNAGGPGIMMSDALEMADLTMAKLDEETKSKLTSLLPAAASANNPVDVLGDANGELYGAAIDILLASDSVDSLVVILTPQKMTDDADTAQHIVNISKKYDKPVLACFMGAQIISKGIEILRENKIPQYAIPERAARAMRQMVSYSNYKKRPLREVERFAVNKIPVIKTIKSSIERGQYEIGEVEAKNILDAYNFNVPPGMLATTVDEAVRFSNELGYPIAMKISSPDILHKSDIGGVKVGLKNASEVEDAFELMMLKIKRKKPDAEVRGVLIERMVLGGREVILGMNKDPQFGPILMFGLGGIFVEVLKDVTFGLAPLTREECLSMIESTKSYKLLTGARGQKPYDINAIVNNLQRLSQLVLDFPEIDEIDMNPLKVGHEGDGASVVDARIILSKEI
ncbi:acetate--CoA ligase family protein [Chitinispirillales bacterium ANBcel5]|uniref:acetate--CoA ligase alpha subunit n=1 Tax=Cellulosispirillum alkaliphilum TaxID=3039283 RepID=UPI002A513B69|nr:acetate--CoA ligase family protein [Chitinispirillales bacterium ANBcel5]